MQSCKLSFIGRMISFTAGKEISLSENLQYTKEPLMKEKYFLCMDKHTTEFTLLYISNLFALLEKALRKTSHHLY